MEQLPTVDACLIVRNEAKGIKKCLVPLLSDRAFNRVYVDDTGSTDGTWKILEQLAKSYPHKLSIREVEPLMWCTEAIDGFDHIDFSANRNRVMERSDADWVFIIDGDEEFVRRGVSVREMAAAADSKGFDFIGVRMDITPDRAGNDGPQPVIVKYMPRMLRREVCHYQGPIHNQPTHKDAPIDEHLEILTYADERGREPGLLTSYKGKLKHRSDRSRAALLRWHAEADEADNAREMARSARYLAPECFYRGEYAQAEHFCKVFLKKASHGTMEAFGGAVFPVLIECCIRRRALDEAYYYLTEGKKLFPLHVTLHQMHASFSLADYAMAVEVGEAVADGTPRINGRILAKPLQAFVRKAGLPWTLLIHRVMRENFEKQQEMNDEE